MHLDEQNYELLLAGAEFPGCEELARHLEEPCPHCETFLSGRSPGSLLKGTRPAANVALTAARATVNLARPATPPRSAARMGRSMRTENLAVVLTDIKGYTERTSRQTRAQNERLLQLHEALLLPVFRAFNGVVRKSIGDAFLVTFESPTNAVLCGAAIQDRLYGFNQTAPEADRFEVRVVVHQGEVRVEPGDVFGEPVTVAKSVEELAEASEVTFTEAVYLVMNKAEVPAVELGQYELKGAPEKLRLFKIPRGPHRLTGTTDAAAGQLPFGGLGLHRAANLATPDLHELERALVARQTRRALLAQTRQYVQSPAGIRSVVGVAALVLVFGGAVAFKLARTPKIERAIDSGQMSEARAMLEAMPAGAERTFWQARIEEKQRKLPDAIADYTEAARAEPKLVEKAIDRLAQIAADGECPLKVRVADALGELGEGYGKPVLEKLTKEEPQKAGGLSGIFGGRCDPAGHADAALKKLGAR